MFLNYQDKISNNSTPGLRPLPLTRKRGSANCASHLVAKQQCSKHNIIPATVKTVSCYNNSVMWLRPLSLTRKRAPPYIRIAVSMS